MNKKVWLVLLAIVVLSFGAYIFWEMQNNVGGQNNNSVAVPPDSSNAAYVIEGQSVVLVGGKAEIQAAPGSASQITTTIFGEPAIGDINGDGKPDAAVILVQDSGGSGIFYYAAADITGNSGPQGTNALFLGDRIAPQNIAIQNGQIVVNYADREPGEPMTAAPSVGVTKYFSYNGLMLQAVSEIAGPGEPCGGNMTTAAVCESGYHCVPAPGSHLPFGDVGGTCVQN